MTRATGALACAAIILVATGASAQPRPPGRVDAAVGLSWNGGTTMATLAAAETQGDGTARTVFDLDREQSSAAGVEGRIGVRLTPRVDVEATGSYARPKLLLKASNDVEGAAAATASEQLQEFTVGGAALWYLRRRDGTPRALPFLAVGVEYMRLLHETNTLAQTGAMVDVGAGVKRTLTMRRGALKAVGIRGDGRARITSAALAVDAATHVTASLAASIFFRF